MSTHEIRAPRPVEGGDDPEPRAGILSALEAGLQQVLSGFQVLDRELTFDAGGRVDLAGADDEGRLTLVLLAEDADRAALEVLDALAFARGHAELVARHLGEAAGARVSTDLPPRLIVVSPDGDERLLRRLAPLRVGTDPESGGVELFGVRTVRSRGGERSYLVPLEPAAIGTPADTRRPEELFLESLAEGERALAQTLLARMARLDESLVLSARRERLAWRYERETLVRLDAREGTLFASVGPHHEARPLGGAPGLERLIESALGRLVQLLGRDEPSRPTRPRTSRLRRPAREPEPRERSEEGEEELLTAEELEAFRD